MAINVCYRTDSAGYCDQTDSMPMIFDKAGVSELNLYSVFVAVGGATLSSLDRSDRVGAMTGAEQNHANWKEREIQRVCSSWAADLCLVVELPELVE